MTASCRNPPQWGTECAEVGGARIICGRLLGLILPVGLAVFLGKSRCARGLSTGRLVPPPVGDLQYVRGPRRDRRAAASHARDAGGAWRPGLCSGWLRPETILGRDCRLFRADVYRLLDPTPAGLAGRSFDCLGCRYSSSGSAIFEASKIILIAVGRVLPSLSRCHGRGCCRSIARSWRWGACSACPASPWCGGFCCRRCCRLMCCRCAPGSGWAGCSSWRRKEFLGASQGLGFLLIDGQTARQAGADRRCDRGFCNPRQVHGLAHCAHRRAVPALGKDVVVRGLGDADARPRPRRQDLPERRARARRPSRSKSRAGEILVVIGGSGCGKSTMLRAISGLDTPTQGAGRARGRADHCAAREDRRHLPGAAAAAVAAGGRQCRLRPPSVLARGTP